eukprot:scaffold256298_cov28-Tisochrysis_lutea.AAC.1
MRDAFFGVDDCGAADNNYTGVRNGRGGVQGAPASARVANGGCIFLCGDRVGLYCDMDQRVLAFYRNGVHIPGLLFRHLPGGEYYVAATLVRLRSFECERVAFARVHGHHGNRLQGGRRPRRPFPTPFAVRAVMCPVAQVHPGASVRMATASPPPLPNIETARSIESPHFFAARGSTPAASHGVTASPSGGSVSSSRANSHPGSSLGSPRIEGVLEHPQHQPPHLAQPLPLPQALQPRPQATRAPAAAPASKLPLVQLPALPAVSGHARPALDRALAKRQKSAAEVEMDLFLEQARRERRARMALASLGVEPTPSAIAASVEREKLQEAACVAYLLASLHEERVRVGSSSPVGPTTRGGSAQSHPAATAGSELTPSPSPRLKAITLPLIKWTLRSEIPGHRHDPFVAIADVRAPDGTPWEVNTAGESWPTLTTTRLPQRCLLGRRPCSPSRQFTA